jgi:hypothetical protein
MMINFLNLACVLAILCSAELVANRMIWAAFARNFGLVPDNLLTTRHYVKFVALLEELYQQCQYHQQMGSESLHQVLL